MIPNQIIWCAQRLDRLNVCLSQQGFSPAHIEYLTQKRPRFKRKFSQCVRRLDELTYKITQDPHAYHWVEEIDRTIQSFLTFTNGHRDDFLNGCAGDLAKTA